MLRLVLLILFLPRINIACLDILFAVDPLDVNSLSRAQNIGRDVSQHSGIRPIVIVNNTDGDYVAKTTRHGRDLLQTIERVQGNFSDILDVVTAQVTHERDHRPLVVLLFSDNELNGSLVQNWKEITIGELHLFRVGTLDMSSSSPMGEVDGPSFETLLKCQRKQSREERQVKRQANSITESIVEKRITSQFKPFSKTTRPPHTTRSKSSKPKLRPIFRGGTTAFVLDEDTQVLVSTPGLPTTITQRTTTSPNLQNPTTVASTDSSSSRTASTRSISRTPPLLPRKLFIPPVTKETTSTVSSTLFRLQVATTTTSPSTTLKPVPKSCVVDIIFLVDLSKGSGDRTKHYFDVGAAVVGALPIGSNAVRVGMIGYSGPGRSYVIFDLKKHGNKDNLIEELFQSVSTGGTTRTGEAISFATKELLSKGNNGARADAKKVLVVFTDGFSQDDPFDSASYARHQGIKTIAVAMMDHFSPNTDELLHIAGQKDNILLSPKGSQLRERILDKSCTLTSA